MAPVPDQDDLSQLIRPEDSRLSFRYHDSQPFTHSPNTSAHYRHQLSMNRPEWIPFPRVSSTASYSTLILTKTMSTSGSAHGVVPIDRLSNHVIDFAQSDHNPALIFGGSSSF